MKYEVKVEYANLSPLKILRVIVFVLGILAAITGVILFIATIAGTDSYNPSAGVSLAFMQLGSGILAGFIFIVASNLLDMAIHNSRKVSETAGYLLTLMQILKKDGDEIIIVQPVQKSVAPVNGSGEPEDPAYRYTR